MKAVRRMKTAIRCEQRTWTVGDLCICVTVITVTRRLDGDRGHTPHAWINGSYALSVWSTNRILGYL